MVEQNVDVVIRARDLTREAFKQVEAALAELDKDVEEGNKKKKISFNDVKAGVTALAGVVTGLAAGVAVLGSRGADVLDIKQSFDQLNMAIGQDSVGVLAALKESFAGTVSDFTLMKMSNTALQAGFKGTTEDFRLLADAARVMADRTGIDAVKAFEMLSKGMVTGRTRGVEMMTGIIDNKKVLEAYALSVHKTVKELSEEERATAFSIAVKTRLQATLIQTGKATVDFGDQVAQTRVKITNFVDGIGEWVATSPSVGAWSSVITGVAGSVTALALSVGPVTTGIKTLLPMLGVAGGAGMIGSLGALAIAAAPVVAILGGFAAALYAVTRTGFTDYIDTLVLSLRGYNFEEAALAVNSKRKLAQLKELTPEVKKLSLAQQDAVALEKMEAEALGLLNIQTEKAKEAAKALTEWKTKQATAYRAFQNEMGELEIKRVEESIKKAKELAEADRVALDQMREHHREMLAKELEDKDAAARLYLDRELQLHNDQLTLDKEYYRMKSEVANAAGLALMEADIARMKNGYKAMFADLPNVIMGAFMGGGDVGKAIGGSIFSKLFAESGPLGSALKKGAEGLGKMAGGSIGKFLGSSLGSMIPGIGTMLGGLAGQMLGPLMGKIGGFFKNLFGGVSAAEQQGREAAASFRSEMELILSAEQRVEAGNEKWKMSIIAVRDAYIKAGHTEREALDVMDRLWKAEKEGGDAVAKVIEEIRRSMAEGVKPALIDATAEGQKFRDVLSEPIEIDIEFNVGDIDWPEGMDPDGNGGVSPFSAPSQADIDAFLKANPGDTHRIKEAFTNITDEQANAAGIFSYASGGYGNFGGGTPAMLHGREAIIPLDRPSLIGQELIAEITRIAGSQVDNSRLERMEQAVESLTRSVLTLPGIMTNAVRDGVLLGPRR